MREVLLSTIKPGAAFEWCGAEFVALEQTDNGCFCITKDNISGCVPFSKDRDEKRNNLYGSYLLEAMLRWLRELCGEQSDCEDVVGRYVDLTSMDGMDDYGSLFCAVAPLTIDEYRKYSKIIPPASDYYWLATPWSCKPDYANYAFNVNTVGTLYNDYAYYALIAAPRPALYLKSSIFVSVEGENEESTPEQKEMALYEAAVEKFGVIPQIDQAIEEMAELMIALNKYKRFLRSDEKTCRKEDVVRYQISEERADVARRGLGRVIRNYRVPKRHHRKKRCAFRKRSDC